MNFRGGFFTVLFSFKLSLLRLCDAQSAPNYVILTEKKVQGLFEMNMPGRYTPGKTGRLSYRFDYPLHWFSAGE